MPQVYTVPTNNAFAALDDESEDELILSQTSAHLHEAPASRERSPPGNRRPRAPRSEDRRPRAQELIAGDPSDNHIKEPVKVRRKVRDEATRSVRAGGKMYEQVIDRQHDRQSNTGRGREVKKDGGGAHNWGVPGAEWDDSADTPQVPKEETQPAPVAGVPEKPPTLTYAEYAAEQARNFDGLELKAPVKKATQIGDDVQVYTKPKTDNLPAKQANTRVQETHPHKQIPVNLRYPRGDNRRREEYKRSSPRQQQAPQAEIKLDDNSAFPTLAH